MNDHYNKLLDWAIDIHNGAEILRHHIADWFRDLLKPVDPYPELGPNAPPHPTFLVSLKFDLRQSDRIAEQLVAKYAPADFGCWWGHEVNEGQVEFYVEVGKGRYSHRVPGSIRERRVRFVLATVAAPEWVQWESDVVDETNVSVIGTRLARILKHQHAWNCPEWELAQQLGLEEFMRSRPLPTE